MAARQSTFDGTCSICIFNGYQYCLGKCSDLGDECFKGEAFTYISECVGTNSTDSQCFQNYTITNADVGLTYYIDVNLADAQWCYIVIQDNITNKYLKDTIANWQLHENNTAFLMYLEAETATVNSTVLNNLNVSDSEQFLQSMSSGINNMISNYTHVLFAMNPYKNNTAVLFSIQFSEGVKNIIMNMKVILTLLLLIIFKYSLSKMAQNHSYAISSIYQIPAAKALFGAALIQYTLYSVIYIIEGFKLQEFEGDIKPKHTPKARPALPNPSNNPGVDQEQEEQPNQKPTDLKDIALEDEMSNEHENQATPQVSSEPQKVNDSMTEDNEDNSFEMPFLMLIPKHYQKSTIWFMVALGLCAVRAPNDLTISVAYIQVFFRLVQMIGAILHKRRVAQIGYILSTICITILFFAAMVHGLSNQVLPSY